MCTIYGLHPRTLSQTNTHTHAHTQTDKHTDTRHRDTGTHRHTHAHKHTRTYTYRHTDTDTDTHTFTNRQTDRHTHSHTLYLISGEEPGLRWSIKDSEAGGQNASSVPSSPCNLLCSSSCWVGCEPLITPGVMMKQYYIFSQPMDTGNMQSQYSAINNLDNPTKTL